MRSQASLRWNAWGTLSKERGGDEIVTVTAQKRYFHCNYQYVTEFCLPMSYDTLLFLFIDEINN
jgi:hypothetical protein